MIVRYLERGASRSHAERGKKSGFSQLGPGKAAPLRRMGMGKWPVYYSPKREMTEGRSLQMFTAIGKVVGKSVCAYTLLPAFTPFRRDAEYPQCKTPFILPLVGELPLHSRFQHWGAPFRTGHFEITEDDFLSIGDAMEVGLNG